MDSYLRAATKRGTERQMATSVLTPLAFLYTDGRDSVEGATRFQKLVFITQEETDVPSQYDYHADRFGPFSPSLHDDLDELERRGYLERETVTNAAGHERHVFAITPDGITAVRRLLERQDGLRRFFDAVQSVKCEHNNTPLDALLRYVYRTYPAYTTETELDLDRLFDPAARSEHLQPEDPTEQFVGTAPGEWKKRNSSAEDLFEV